jgi:hypothetical protein
MSKKASGIFGQQFQRGAGKEPGKLTAFLAARRQAALGPVAALSAVPGSVTHGRTVGMNDVVDVHRPVAGDVIELILADHELFELLLRKLRDASSDRAAVRDALANVLVAHAEAEEKYVYPKLRKRSAVGAHEAEHSEEEHAEGHEALLKVLELKGTGTKAFDDAVEELSATLNHHMVEEELTILNPAREEVGEAARAQLGLDFLTERNAQLDADCGRIENVRAIVARDADKGLLDEEDEGEE